MEVVNYRELEGINQSLLKKILISPSAFLHAQKNMYKESGGSHFVFGSLLDFIMTEDMTTFKDHYIMQEFDLSASDAIMQVLDKAAEELTFTDESLISIAKDLKYGQSYKEETRLNKIKVENWSEYIQFKIDSAGKNIITKEDYKKATICREALQRNPYTKKYFIAEEGIEIIKKVVIQNVIQGIDFKYELDFAVINHNNKTIHPIDLKSIGDTVYNFYKNFWKFRYDFQGAAYYNACSDHFSDLIADGYKLENFKFIVIEKDYYNPPLIYRMSDETHKLAAMGGEIPPRKANSLNEAIGLLKWHTSEDKWEYTKEYYDNGYISI